MDAAPPGGSRRDAGVQGQRTSESGRAPGGRQRRKINGAKRRQWPRRLGIRENNRRFDRLRRSGRRRGAVIGGAERAGRAVVVGGQNIDAGDVAEHGALDDD